MTTRSFDIDTVTALLRDVARDVVLPRFRMLRDDEIERKMTASDPEDIVTIVDRRVEARVTAALREIDPEARVVGEEAVHQDPDLLRHLSADEPVWLLDPIDGTKNFARGLDGFGIMLARLRHGLAQAAWVFLPARRQMFVAEAGSGAFLDGARLTVPETSASALPRGTVHTRYMPATLAAALRVAGDGNHVPAPDTGASAIEYTAILRGERDFGVYYRLLPWDHAPAALILTEAGGRVDHLDGSPYTARSTSQVTVVAVSDAVSGAVRAWLRSAVNDGTPPA